jgi:mRNA interferase MazF
MVTPHRGDIFWVNLDPTVGTEIRKKRPAVIISNDAANKRYHQITVIPLTSQNVQSLELFQTFIPSGESGLNKDSKALAEQVRTISKLRLGSKVGHLDSETMQELEKALRVHLDLV